jgi:hypothetical protein
VRIAISLAAIMLMGILLGFAFPSGMRLIEAIDPEAAPWFRNQWSNGRIGVRPWRDVQHCLRDPHNDVYRRRLLPLVDSDGTLLLTMAVGLACCAQRSPTRLRVRTQKSSFKSGPRTRMMRPLDGALR